MSKGGAPPAWCYCIGKGEEEKVSCCMTFDSCNWGVADIHLNGMMPVRGISQRKLLNTYIATALLAWQQRRGMLSFKP